jgi:uncharacterized membrane protein
MTLRSRKNDHFPYRIYVMNDNHSDKMTFPLLISVEKLIRHFFFLSSYMLICSLYTHAHINVFSLLLISFFFCYYWKTGKKNSLVSLISPKIYKKKNERQRAKDVMERRLIEWNNDHTSYSFIFFLISSYTKDDETNKKSAIFASIIDEKWVGTKEDVDHDHFSCH